MSDLVSEIFKSTQSIAPQMCDWRRTIHSRPELSFEEHETCAYIQKQLSDLGVSHRVIGKTGVVAHIGRGARCVAIRADIDALPIQEETGLPFASEKAGVMHACGHDAHTAMLLGAARVLKERESTLGGIVKLIFQPGEEKHPGGASVVIGEGVLNDPTPEIIFGQHIDPELSVGTLQVSPGPMFAGDNELLWAIQGRGGHAAQPERVINPVTMAAHLVEKVLERFEVLRKDVQHTTLAITRIRGGSAGNVVPDRVRILGTFRSYDSEWKKRVLEEVETLSKSLCEARGGKCKFSVSDGYPPVINDAPGTRFIEEVARGVFAEKNVQPCTPKLFGEDFGFYGQHIPSVFWMLGVKKPEIESASGLHTSTLFVDEAALPYGSAMLAGAAVSRLSS